MRVVNECVIKGAGHFVGTVEGQEFNNGQLFIEEPFDTSKPTYRGFRTVEYKCRDSSVVMPLMEMEFPIKAKVTMELSATKRGQAIVVLSVEPTSVVRTASGAPVLPSRGVGS